MFIAYSKEKDRIVNVNECFDLNEVFRCPNPNCNALFTIRSVDGHRRKHFGRLPSTPHIMGCIYATDDNRYNQPGKLSKYSIDAIFNKRPPENEPSPIAPRKSSTKEGERTLAISTPLRLLNFCLYNSLSTEYLDGICVDDLILYSENLLKDGRFEGITGKRFLYGLTNNSNAQNSDTLYFSIKKKTSSNKEVTLHVAAKVGVSQLQTIRKYLIGTYGKFAGHPIAIWGDWRIDRKYWVSCEVQDAKHIIFRFKA